MKRNETMLQHVLRDEVNAQRTRLDLFLHLLDQMFEITVPYASSVPLSLLVASILKLRQSGRAVQLLAEQELVEEVLALGRAMVELTVNVCYLQRAPQPELARYLSFHPETQHRYGQLAVSPSNRGVMGRISGALSLLLPSLGPQRHPSGWTHQTLLQRAQRADELTNIPVLAPLLSRCYPRGDAAVHGTIGSLDSFVQAVRAQHLPGPEDRQQEMSEALFGVNLTLMSFTVFLDEYLQLGMQQSIDEISSAEAGTRPSLAGR